MPYCDVNGAQLYYESYGSGPALVLVHGSGGNHASWFNQVPVFSKTYRVIVYDQRGFGNTEDPTGAGRSKMVADLAGLLDALQIDRAVLVGQSLGGGACIGVTRRMPQRVAALVLCDTLVGMQLPPEVAARMKEQKARTVDLSQPERVLGPRTRETHPELSLLYSQIASFNTYTVHTMPGAFELVSPEELAATGTPVLYVLGSDDVLFPPECIRQVQARVSNSTLVELEGVGHSAYFEDAAGFNRHLASFLSPLVGPI